MKDDLKKKSKMEDDLKKNGRRPQKKNKKMEDYLKKIIENNLKIWIKIKIEDDLKKNWKMKTSKKKSFLIPLKFWGKPFLGLAELSKIFSF